MKREITYFDNPGKQNTQETLALARARALKSGFKRVLVASTHGYTAREAVNVFGDGVEVIAVTISEAYKQEDWRMLPQERRELERIGVKVLTAQHSLSGGVAESFLGGDSPLSIIASTLYCFSQGMKVAVEIAIMAAEAGLIPAGEEILSVAGSSEGADTAVVLKPAYARNFQDFRILEILCKPRIG